MEQKAELVRGLVGFYLSLFYKLEEFLVLQSYHGEEPRYVGDYYALYVFL
jgi:hypothetical protein